MLSYERKHVNKLDDSRWLFKI